MWRFFVLCILVLKLSACGASGEKNVSAMSSSQASLVHSSLSVSSQTSTPGISSSSMKSSSQISSAHSISGMQSSSQISSSVGSSLQSSSQITSSFSFSSSSSNSSTQVQNFYTESFEATTPEGNSAYLFWTGPTFNQVTTLPHRPNATGTRSLQFHYPAGTNTSWEERFQFTSAYREIWIRYWLRVPTNYIHRSNPDSGASNNKLFAIWMDDYSWHGLGPTVIWEFWDNGNSGSDLAVHYSEGNNTGAGPHRSFTPFISYPSDQGRWMQIMLHIKAATNSSSSDGVIDMYRRWENEILYSHLHHITDANISVPAAGPDGWSAGYFMGWSNPGYAEDTDFYIDDLEFSASQFMD